jgi:hypothetical protein
MHEKNIESRNELIRSASARLNIRGFDLQTMNETHVDEFRSKLREVRKKRKLALDEVQVRFLLIHVLLYLNTIKLY